MLPGKCGDSIYQNTSVFITGHTGFKGSWLSLWLNELGAKVAGYSQDPATSPNHFDLLDLKMTDHRDDLKNVSALKRALLASSPEIIFHLAAQPLVRASYEKPALTWETNVMGTVNVLEAARHVKSVKAIVIVTTDKVYENHECERGYEEEDRLGGHDPYSASKAAVEIVVESYRKSFFQGKALLATARAGNVIGGGDWQVDRLLPDLVRAIAAKQPMLVRSPNSIRPWQHVLDCLYGYLLLGGRLLNGEKTFEGAWNFGPAKQDHVTVETFLKMLQKNWKDVRWSIQELENAKHETTLLFLDAAKAKSKLGWKPVWNLEKSLHSTAEWYLAWLENQALLSQEQLKRYINDATTRDEAFGIKSRHLFSKTG